LKFHKIIIIVTLKWNKQVFENIELDLDQPPAIFKAQLFSITGVDPERQKVIIKGVTIKVLFFEKRKLKSIIKIYNILSFFLFL